MVIFIHLHFAPLWSDVCAHVISKKMMRYHDLWLNAIFVSLFWFASRAPDLIFDGDGFAPYSIFDGDAPSGDESF